MWLTSGVESTLIEKYFDSLVSLTISFKTVDPISSIDLLLMVVLSITYLNIF